VSGFRIKEEGMGQGAWRIGQRVIWDLDKEGWKYELRIRLRLTGIERSTSNIESQRAFLATTILFHPHSTRLASTLKP
jgi:hypothetical protein